MGIGINVRNLKPDYSYLFQSMTGGNSASLNFLSDYASIKNGSYGKLMKAYYSPGHRSGNEVSSIVERIPQRRCPLLRARRRNLRNPQIR